MEAEEFISCLDRYGSDLTRWPPDLRHAAEALLQQGPGEAWKQYRVASLVDGMLSATVPPASRQLVDRILFAASQEQTAAFNLFDLFTVWQKRLLAGAVFASLVGGVVVGWTTTSSVTVNDDIYEDVPGLTWSPGEFGGSQ